MHWENAEGVKLPLVRFLPAFSFLYALRLQETLCKLKHACFYSTQIAAIQIRSEFFKSIFRIPEVVFAVFCVVFLPFVRAEPFTANTIISK